MPLSPGFIAGDNRESRQAAPETGCPQEDRAEEAEEWSRGAEFSWNKQHRARPGSKQNKQ